MGSPARSGIPLRTRPLSIALVGNPNTGKSTLFNALAGTRQKVGNYPGVTVEKKTGKTRLADGREVELIDLPGTYSLAPRSPDEMVAVDVLLGREPGEPRPDLVICILDASNLARNLYLFSQVRELGLPVVVALNMIDLAQRRGIGVEIAELERRLGVPVVAIQANKGKGIDALKARLATALDHRDTQATALPPLEVLPTEVRAEVEGVVRALDQVGHPLPRYLAERLLLDPHGQVQRELLEQGEPLAGVLEQVHQARERLKQVGKPVPAIEAMARYEWIGRVLDGVVVSTTPASEPPADAQTTAKVDWSDRLDRVLTHRVWGSLVFLLLMAVMFYAIFQFAVVPMDAIDSGFAWLGDRFEESLPDGALKGLAIDGVLGGVGGVVVFLPQIMILFMFLTILEDCGYLARAAYLADRLLKAIGLSGKSFIPLLSAHACAIPAVMASRVIEERRDRLATILVTPLMSCSARLPVYFLMAGAFLPREGWNGWLQPLAIFSMYAIGWGVAIAAALIFKRSLLKGPTPPFVMELPTYKWPSPVHVVRRMIEEGLRFLRRAGTLILAVSIVVWALLYFPRDAATVEAAYRTEIAMLEQALETLPENDPQRASLQERREELDTIIEGDYQRSSVLGRFGRAIEPVVKPLGWDWRIGVAALASFPAREVVVGVLGVMFDAGEVDAGDEVERVRLGESLRQAQWPDGSPLFTVPVALSIMVFFALCSQCAATLVVIRKETGGWKWAGLTFAYMTGLAYLGALITYQVGTYGFGG